MLLKSLVASSPTNAARTVKRLVVFLAVVKT